MSAPKWFPRFQTVCSLPYRCHSPTNATAQNHSIDILRSDELSRTQDHGGIALSVVPCELDTYRAKGRLHNIPRSSCLGLPCEHLHYETLDVIPQIPKGRPRVPFPPKLSTTLAEPSSSRCIIPVRHRLLYSRNRAIPLPPC